MRDPDVVAAESGEDGATGFGGQHLRREHSGNVSREKPYEERRDVRGGVGDGSVIAPLLPDLVERREHTVAADQQVLIFLFAVLHAAHQDGGRKPGILQDPLTDELRNRPR